MWTVKERGHLLASVRPLRKSHFFRLFAPRGLQGEKQEQLGDGEEPGHE